MNRFNNFADHRSSINCPSFIYRAKFYLLLWLVSLFCSSPLFSQTFLAPSRTPQHEIFFADFNLDRKADLVVRTLSSSEVKIYYNLNRNFSPTPNVISNNAVPDTNTWELLFADYNGDGSADLINRNLQSGTSFVHFWTGAGFHPVAAISFATPAHPSWKSLIQDFNADGSADLINLNLDNGDIFVHYNQSGVISSSAQLIFNALAVPANPNPDWEQAFADIDGDADIDFMNIYLPYMHFNIHYRNGSSFAPSSYVLEGPAEAYEYQYFLADCNADGIADVIRHNLRNGDILAFPVKISSAGPTLGTLGLLRGNTPPYIRPSRNKKIPIQNNRSLDVATWYDVDYLAATGRPDNGWFNLNPNHPNDVPSSSPNNQWRTTTFLLGRYQSNDPNVIKQHAYWFASAGISALVIDWTNIRGSLDPNKGNNFPYHNLVRQSTEAILQRYNSLHDIIPPRIIIAMRIPDKCTHPGANPSTCSSMEDYAGATFLANDVMNLVNQFPNQFYYFEDQSTQSQKPILISFFSQGLPIWLNSPPYPWNDSRFNIRFSNGFLAGNIYTEPESAQWIRIKNDAPFWTFYEPRQPGALAAYQGVYRRIPGTSISEQATATVAMYQPADCTLCWDHLLHTFSNGLNVLQSSLLPFWSKPPRFSLITRFNYPLGWYAQPLEGLSLTKSMHFEPSQDLQFSKFNEVAVNSFQLRKLNFRAPYRPVVTLLSSGDTIVYSSGNYPTEYALTMTGQAVVWKMVETKSARLRLPIHPPNQQFQFKTRNAWGESPTTIFNVP